jgi:hypothetical protein
MVVSMKVMLSISILVVFSIPSATAQRKVPQDSFPLAEDVETLDGIIRAYYEVVSAPAGQPKQVERDHSLHHALARVAVTGKDKNGKPFVRMMTLDEYYKDNTVAESGFFEKEIHRVTQKFGNIVHVWSTYEWRTEENGPLGGRGINSIQLYHDGNRWWITSWIYDSERKDNPIPPEFLP